MTHPEDKVTLPIDKCVDAEIRGFLIRLAHALTVGKVKTSELHSMDVQHLPECKFHTEWGHVCNCRRLLVLNGKKGERIEIDHDCNVTRSTRN